MRRKNQKVNPKDAGPRNLFPKPKNIGTAHNLLTSLSQTRLRCRMPQIPEFFSNFFSPKILYIRGEKSLAPTAALRHNEALLRKEQHQNP
jgi:hypothetical protein